MPIFSSIRHRHKHINTYMGGITKRLHNSTKDPEDSPVIVKTAVIAKRMKIAR